MSNLPGAIYNAVPTSERVLGRWARLVLEVSAVLVDELLDVLGVLDPLEALAVDVQYVAPKELEASALS
eukprot:2036715-Amphidinium_carterae.1